MRERSPREATGAGEQPSAWIEIDAAAYRHNLRALQRVLAPGVRRMAVVKANAYGHGARLITALAVAEGVDYLGVHSRAEQREILDLAAGVPILLLGPTLPAEVPEAVACGAELTVSDLGVVRRIGAAARAQQRRVGLHLKIETGTHRQGILLEEIPDWCALLAEYPELLFQGLHTHYANIEDTTDHTVARRQLARLAEARQRFTAAGQAPVMIHSACSAAAIVMEQTHGDLVRLGIASYGLWPSRETFLSALLSQRAGPELIPVLAWKARIAQIKEVPVGEYIGYGCTFRTTHAMRLAVLPVGYYDGYDRRLSGRGHVLVRGRRAPVVGRVCMNMTMVDITDLPEVAIGEEVTLVGQSGGETIGTDALAALCGTINYEIVARLGAHLPRRYKGGDWG